jgi:hypothetical protein
MLRRDLNSLIDVSAVEEIETRNPFLRFGEGAVGDHALALSDAPGLADIGQTIANDPASFLVVARDSFLCVVLTRIVGLARGRNLRAALVRDDVSELRLVREWLNN